jgi:hypothetical protein
VRFVRRALHLDSTTVSIVSSEKLDPERVFRFLCQGDVA